MQRGIHVFVRCACARFQKTLFEIVAEKRVQNRIHSRVRVRETTGNEMDGDDEL